MFERLTQSPLFAGMKPAEIEALIANASAEWRQYGPDDIVALKGAHYKGLMIVAEGSVRYETGVGKAVSSKAEELAAPAIITPGLLYAPNPEMPAHLVANEPTTVIVIEKKAFTAVMQQEARVLEHFLETLSDSKKTLSDKVLYLGFKTMKGRFAHLVLKQAEQEGSETFRLELTQREMAELFGVTRPALARAIREMSEEGAIYVDRKQVTILYPEKLKQYIKE